MGVSDGVKGDLLEEDMLLQLFPRRQEGYSPDDERGTKQGCQILHSFLDEDILASTS